MFIELVDTLRCPRSHAESWLVASVEHMEGRDIVLGTLGCPVCRSEFAVSDGMVNFREAPSHHETNAAVVSGDIVIERPSAESAVRLAALLNLVEEGGYAMLYGRWAAYAAIVEQMAPMHLLLINPPVGLQMGAGSSGIGVDDVLPLAMGSARAIALDGSVNAALVASAVRVLAPRGRMVAPVALPVPEGICEVTRDGSLWVGERETQSGYASSAPSRRSLAHSAIELFSW